MANIVEEIAKSLGLTSTQLKVEDIHAKIPQLKRLASQYTKGAVDAESEAMTRRQTAFSPDTPPADRARLMREYTQFANKAKALSSQASIFIVQYGQFQALETTMMIIKEMEDVGLVAKVPGAVDWQTEMDAMSLEIQRLVDDSKKLGEALKSPMEGTSMPETDELEQLFARWDAETDPVKKAEIQRQIEAKTNVPLV